VLTQDNFHNVIIYMHLRN